MTLVLNPPGHDLNQVPQQRRHTTNTAATDAADFATPSTTPNPIFTDHDEWRAFAVCATDENPDRWVDLPPVRIKGKNNPDYDTHLKELSAVCGGCQVADQCLGTALAMNVRGVFAGTDEYERADLREALGLPTPPMIPIPESEDDARLVEQQFTALRLARRGLSNKEIAAEMDVSAMTVSRLTASEERPAKRRTRRTKQ